MAVWVHKVDGTVMSVPDGENPGSEWKPYGETATPRKPRAKKDQ